MTNRITNALLKEARGRRINLTHAEDSLLLLKGTLACRMAAGLKIDREGPAVWSCCAAGSRRLAVQFAGRSAGGAD